MSQDFILEPKGDHAYTARGALSFESATRALARGLAVLRPGAALEMDLTNVSSGDSAGLAVLIEWLAVAKARNASLRFTGIPAPILAVAQIAEIDELLAQ